MNSLFIPYVLSKVSFIQMTIFYIGIWAFVLKNLSCAYFEEQDLTTAKLPSPMSFPMAYLSHKAGGPSKWFPSRKKQSEKL